MDGRAIDLNRALGWVAGVVVVLFVAYIFLPITACGCSTKEGARKTASISNAKQNGTALLIYAADWEQFPPANAWATATAQYRKYGDTLRDLTLPTKSKYGFAFYSPAELVNPDLIETPERVPLIFQTDKLVLNANGPLSLLPAKPRAEGKDIICFADSSTKRIERGAALSPLRLKPKK